MILQQSTAYRPDKYIRPDNIPLEIYFNTGILLKFYNFPLSDSFRIAWECYCQGIDVPGVSQNEWLELFKAKADLFTKSKDFNDFDLYIRSLIKAMLTTRDASFVLPATEVGLGEANSTITSKLSLPAPRKSGVKSWIYDNRYFNTTNKSISLFNYKL